MMKDIAKTDLTSTDPRPILIGITGASGSIYAMHTIGHLLKVGYRLDLIPTAQADNVSVRELGFSFRSKDLLKKIKEKFGADFSPDSIRIFDIEDFNAPPASGSTNYSQMVIIPCSMKTLSSIATGRGSNLLERAADVILKEKGRLVIVPRETPLSAIHLQNMLSIANAGGTILPAMPGFYNQPRDLDDVADFIVGKVFKLLGLSSDLIKPWGES